MTGLRLRLRATRSDAGYSLVEMVVVMAILGVVMASLTALFVSASHAEVDMSLRWQAQQNARLGLDRLRREIHCASTVTKGSAATPASPIATGSDRITIALPSGCTGGGVNVTWCAVLVSSGRYKLYRVNNSTTCTGGSVIADYLTQPNVFDIAAATTTSLAKVSIDLPVNVRASKPLDTYELRDAIVLRNSVRG